MEKKTDHDGHEKISWGVRRRLDFIDFRLMWDGRVNRKDLVERFQISPPQATTDIERYAQTAPGNVAYDSTEKAFIRGESFEPRFVGMQADRYLLQLQALKLGWLERDQTYFDSVPPTDVATLRRRPLSDAVMMPIVDAIRTKTCVAVRYWTTSGKPATTRKIAPHALAFGAGRWHVRAWNEENGDFRDFNLTRIERARSTAGPAIDSQYDYEWSTVGRLHLRANPELPPEEQASIRREYEFKDDMLILPCRLALLFYLRAEFGLEDKALDPYRRQLVLENGKELEELRNAARKMSVISLEAKAQRG